MFEEILGYVAACCTTLAFIPQVLHIIKTKDTNSISFSMYTIFTVGVAMWLVYGILNLDWPIVAANLITLILASIIWTLKLRDILKKRSNLAQSH